MCVMCAHGNGFPQPPTPTPPLFGAAEALYCSQGLQSESEKADFLRGAKKKKNPPVPLDLLVVCRFSARHLSRTYRTRAS